MPASSRKRNKGKDRKAKQLVKKEENERATEREFWWAFCNISTGCNHGHEIVISNDHPVMSFMDQFFVNLDKRKMKTDDNLMLTFKTHTHIWTNERHRKLAISILLRIGSNLMIRFGTDVDVSWPVCLAQSIVLLEHYNGNDIDSVFNSRVVASTNRDLDPGVSSTRRDTLKFFRKRTSCKCLKKMHLEARKTMPKMGLCWYCKGEKERIHLSVCSSCMINQYCSRQCQVADWPRHERSCKEYARIHKQQSE